MDFTIRRAGPADIDLAREALIEVDGRTVSGDAPIEALLGDPLWYLLVASADGQAVGALWGCALRRAHRPESEFMLYEMSVREAYWNNGIGRALVEAFIAEARRAGAHEVWVLTGKSNARAMAMYARAGLTRQNPDDVMLSIELGDG